MRRGRSARELELKRIPYKTLKCLFVLKSFFGNGLLRHCFDLGSGYRAAVGFSAALAKILLYSDLLEIESDGRTVSISGIGCLYFQQVGK